MNLTPNARASHWSAAWLGRAWTPQFTCWTLVREVQAQLFGRAVPDLDVADTAAVASAIAAGRWAVVQTPAIAGDVITMHGHDGPHIGVALGDGRLLHNVGGMVGDTPRGGVCIDAIDALGALGFGRLKVWRPQA
jgi:cell wall-associated NlpC family hydrolase